MPGLCGIIKNNSICPLKRETERGLRLKDSERSLVSVVIIAYNCAKYICDAIDSVLAQTFQDFEIIIVNDGSTDQKTNDILRNLNKPKTRVIHTVNQGVCHARNTGIKESLGEYILPLDSDDKITEIYLEKAVKVLDENANVGIVNQYNIIV